MRLTPRFFMTHGALVLFTLAVSFFLLFAGSRVLLHRESEKAQRQSLEALALAAREAALQREEVAVMNFMRLAASQNAVVYAAYARPGSRAVLAFPPAHEAEAAAVPRPEGDARVEARTLKDGTRIRLWTRALDPRAPARGGWVALAYSEEALQASVAASMARWVRLGAVAGLTALLLGALAAWGVARHLVSPLRLIRDGTHLVRSGRLGSLVAVDRTDEIGDLARDFNAMVLQLKDLDEMKRDFVAGVTHDLGTPLHAIRSASNYLQAGDAGPLTDKQAEYLLMISNSTQHLIAFINNLLTVSRIEAARLEPFFEPVDVMAHAHELVTLYEAQARERGVELKLTRKVPYVSLVADVTMFRQIVMNLVSNALKFTPQGRVEVVLGEEDGDFLLEVKDTGIGIDPKYHDLVFDKFYRIKQPKEFPVQQGSGLGLSIVKGLVEAHGGRIVLRSEPGRGTDFLVRLPKQPKPTQWYGGRKAGEA
jgi:signal transduction histidine kinase